MLRCIKAYKSDKEFNMSNNRKVEVVGTETYINQRTGEVQEMRVINTCEQDFNFKKIWLAHILEAVDELGNGKMQVLMYLLDKNNSAAGNLVVATQRELATACKVSINTVTRTLRSLEANNIIRRKTGAIYLNPEVVFKGKSKQRMSVLINYEKISNVVDLKNNKGGKYERSNKKKKTA